MNEPYGKVFRGLILAQWAALAASLFVGAVPPEVQEQANQSYASDPRPFLIFVAVTNVGGVLKIIADIGLFLFRPWGRPLFAVMIVFGLMAPFLVTVLPHEISQLQEPPFGKSLGALSTMIDGAVLALAYGSPVAARFRRSGAPHERGAGRAG